MISDLPLIQKSGWETEILLLPHFDHSPSFCMKAGLGRYGWCHKLNGSSIFNYHLVSNCDGCGSCTSAIGPCLKRYVLKFNGIPSTFRTKRYIVPYTPNVECGIVPFRVDLEALIPGQVVRPPIIKAHHPGPVRAIGVCTTRPVCRVWKSCSTTNVKNWIDGRVIQIGRASWRERV